MSYRNLWSLASRELRRCMLLGLGVAALALPVGPTEAACPTNPPGDLTGDGTVDISDVQCAVIVSTWARAGAATGSPPPGCAGPRTVGADFDCDGRVSVLDVQLIIVRAANWPLPGEIDGDANGCPDLCETQCGDGNCTPTETCTSCPADCGSCDVSCYAAHPTPGCNNRAVQDCACEMRPTCCTEAWTLECAGLARATCSQGCCNAHDGTACGDSDCAACVCRVQPACCTGSWDRGCVTLAAGTCADACGCGGR
jgi:hypothetical protein